MGRWEELEDFSGKIVPVGGLAYYITPPASLSNVFTDPFHSVFYVTFILMSCAIFSKAWMDVSGSSSLVRDGGMIWPAAASGRLAAREAEVVVLFFSRRSLRLRVVVIKMSAVGDGAWRCQ